MVYLVADLSLDIPTKYTVKNLSSKSPEGSCDINGKYLFLDRYSLILCWMLCTILLDIDKR